MIVFIDGREGAVSMNLQHLEYFLALTRTSSFTQASQVMRISQSTLSSAVAKLERELGVPLIDRSSKQFKLTRYGDIVCAEAADILSEVSKCENRIKVQRRIEQNGLSIGVTTNYDYPMLLEFLQGFKNSINGEVSVTFRQGTYGALIDALQSSELDFVFGVSSPLHEPISGVDRALLHPVPLFCNVSTSHPLAGYRTISLSMLDGEVIACYSKTMMRVYERFRKQTDIELLLLPNIISIPMAQVATALGECIGFDCRPWDGQIEGVYTAKFDAPKDFSPSYSVQRVAGRGSALVIAFWDYIKTMAP